MLPMQEGPVSILVHIPPKKFLKKKKSTEYDVRDRGWEDGVGWPRQKIPAVRFTHI